MLGSPLFGAYCSKSCARASAALMVPWACLNLPWGVCRWSAPCTTLKLCGLANHGQASGLLCSGVRCGSWSGPVFGLRDCLCLQGCLLVSYRPLACALTTLRGAGRSQRFAMAKKTKSKAPAKKPSAAKAKKPSAGSSGAVVEVEACKS